MYKPIPSPVYPRAPIIEAVIELRASSDVTPETVEKIARRLKKRYDKSTDEDKIDFVIDSTGGRVSVHQQGQARGRRLATLDQSNIVIVNQRALVTACLSPYPGWEVFSKVARSNWTDWRSEAPAQSIEKVYFIFICGLIISLL